MGVLGAAEQDDMDLVTFEIAVPRPRLAMASLVDAGQAGPAAGRKRRAGDVISPAPPRSAPARSGPAPGSRELHVRQVRELHVRELRTPDRQERESGTREVRFRQAAAREVRTRQVRTRQVRTREVRTLAVHARERGVRETTGGQPTVPGAPGSGMSGPGRAAHAMRPARSGRPGRVRLTRRGRVVLAALAVVTVTAMVTAFWLSVAGGAQAASHGLGSGAAYRGMTRVVVRPGQTLWSIASQAEPAADPRLVIQQIIQANALGGPVIQPGQSLWVPKG
jgi:LysM domain